MAGSQPEAPKSHQCVGCGAWSPQTTTNYTLISSQYGWRLSRELDRSGHKMMVWRCPSCWAKRKQSSSATSSSWPPRFGSQPPSAGTGNIR